LQAELSVVLARGTDGRCAVHPTVANTHVGGILDLTVVPAPTSDHVAAAATTLAISIASALGYVGVLAVEMFVVDGELLVNELAPRPHNSGHWTLDAAATSQFEQQVRAVCGLPLGDPSLVGPGAAMVNLLGDEWAGGAPDWSAALADGGAHLHLYGKTEPRPGRKMGHLTVIGPTPADAARLALTLRSHARRGLQLDH
jgi:5-(carboxyamino)imidazole ribonucleotide synthase